MGTLYRLENVTKAYGTRRVCNIASLEIAEGEILGIMGPNGAGKSTLLRLLAFLEPPTSGQLRFQDRLVNGRLPLSQRRQVTMVFQEPLLLSQSVADNVAFGLKVRGDGQAREKASQALERIGLAHLARAPASTLSGGEVRRLALARALVLTPRVLLLDEPTASLDPASAALVEDTIARLHREQGVAVVLVTHSLFQARRLAQRAALMLEGAIVEIGKTEALFTHPTDPRTAAFLRGEMVY